MSELQKMNLPVSPLLLKQCEAIIEEELKNVKKLVRALEVIEQMKLYSKHYDDFESYCQVRWNTTRDLEYQGKLIHTLIQKENR